jgi:hypothetical protein
VARKQLTIAIACSLVMACDRDTALKRFTPPEHDKLAREFLNAAQTGDTLFVWKSIAPSSLQTPGVRDSVLSAMRGLPKGTVDTLRQVGAHRFQGDDADRSLLSYELHTSAGWAGVNIRVLEDTSGRYIEGFRADRLPASLETTNAFRLSEKNPVTFFVPLLAVACAVFSIFVAVLAVRTRMPRRGLWAFFALLGVASVTMDWTTGQLSFQLLQVTLFCAGIMRIGPAGPWLITVGFPAGALATLYRIRIARSASTSSDGGTVLPAR